MKPKEKEPWMLFYTGTEPVRVTLRDPNRAIAFDPERPLKPVPEPDAKDLLGPMSGARFVRAFPVAELGDRFGVSAEDLRAERGVRFETYTPRAEDEAPVECLVYDRAGALAVEKWRPRPEKVAGESDSAATTRRTRKPSPRKSKANNKEASA